MVYDDTYAHGHPSTSDKHVLVLGAVLYDPQVVAQTPVVVHSLHIPRGVQHDGRISAFLKHNGSLSVMYMAMACNHSNVSLCAIQTHSFQWVGSTKSVDTRELIREKVAKAKISEHCSISVSNEGLQTSSLSISIKCSLTFTYVTFPARPQSSRVMDEENAGLFPWFLTISYCQNSLTQIAEGNISKAYVVEISSPQLGTDRIH